MADGSVCCTASVAIGQHAFNNYNGIGIQLCYSPQPPSAATVAAWQPSPPHLHPPPMLAVVLDASMSHECMQNAHQALAQALSKLNPQTRILLLVVDQVVSVVDLKTSKPQCWVVHGISSQGASVLPQIVRVADIRATPLAHCESFLAHSLAALRHFPHQQSLQHHLRITAAAVDIALFLLSASMAAWDAQHRQQQQQQQQSAPGSGQQLPPRGAMSPDQQQLPQLMPRHNARVMVLTGLPNNSTRTATAAMELLQQLDQQQAQQVQQLFKAVGTKAVSLDIPLDVITGSLAAPAAVLLQEAVNTSYGRLLHQPGLQPPLASNIVATAQSRFGWEGVLDIQVPAGVKVVQLSGPVSAGRQLPDVASMSGREVPVMLFGCGGALGAAAPAEGAAAGSTAASSNVASSSAVAAGGGKAPGFSLSGGPVVWSAAASGVPVLSTGSRFVATLEMSSDWQPGSSFDIQLVCEWTAVDGRRVRQVCSHTVQISDRLVTFLQGLDVPAVVLLMAQRLVAATAAAAVPKTNGLLYAALPKPKALEEGRLSVGMALSHVAQRLGQAHLSRRGLFGFGSQQVWQLPDDLIPLALSLYQLQRSPLFHPTAMELEPYVSSATGSSGVPSTGSGSNAAGDSSIQSSSSSSSDIMYGSWRLLLQQFIQTGPNAALRMVAPWLYVYDASSGQFEVLPPLNLALEPDALAVLDCGSELIIYVGEVLEALVEGIVTPNGREQQQQQLQQLPSPAFAGVKQQQQDGAAAAAAATGGGAPVIESAAAVAAANGALHAASTGGRSQLPDMAVAAAPAVQCAHQLQRGRVPVPAIRLIEDEAGMAGLLRKLVPLHEDPVALQLLLLPHLRDLTPAQHGYLLDWHRHWASVGAGMGEGGAAAAGGARLTAAESQQQQLSFGQWYSSFGVVLRSPGGMIEGSPAVE